jgi:hypothetical protein
MELAPPSKIVLNHTNSRLAFFYLLLSGGSLFF